MSDWEKNIQAFSTYLRFQLRCSEHTSQAYLSDLLHWKKFLDENNLDYRSPDAIRLFIMEIMKNGYQARSVRRKLSSFKKFNFFLKKFNHETLPGIANLSGPKLPQHLPSYFTIREAQAIFEELPDQYEHEYVLLLKNIILQTFYFCGIRRSELIGLKISDVRLQAKELKVLGKRKKERIIPLLPEYVHNLQSYLKAREKIGLNSEYLFVNSKNRKVSVSFVYRTVKDFFQSISSLKQKSPHILRHTFATHLLNRGANIQAVSELLGHSGLSATQVYAHVLTDPMKKAYKKAHPRSGE